jgi:citronellol/citronellal dehydrogenase
VTQRKHHSSNKVGKQNLICKLQILCRSCRTFVIFLAQIITMSFKGKTVFITGASRGIGKAMGLKLAAEGANVVVAAKSVEENPKLGGTIFSAADEMTKAGGNGLAIQLDIRFEDQIAAAVEKTVATFGGIDILINNAT